METVQITVHDGVATLTRCLRESLSRSTTTFTTVPRATHPDSRFLLHRVEGEARRRTHSAKETTNNGGKDAAELFALGLRILNGERPLEAK